MQLLYGTMDNCESYYYTMNFSALIERYEQLDLLPEDTLGAFDERDFDMKYAEFILSDNGRFMRLMNFMINLQTYPVVYLLISEDNWSMSILESFLKLLQVRYGITGTHVRMEADATYAEETDFNSQYGIRNYDEDYARYTYLLEQQRILNGGEVYKDG